MTDRFRKRRAMAIGTIRRGDRHYAARMRNVLATLVAVISVVGCGGDDGGSPGTVDGSIDTPGPVDAANDSPPAMAFALTSTAYAEGAMIPVVHTCDGANTSPPLAWTNPPAGTMGFAIIFIDVFNAQQPLVHSIIYDIPLATTSLPANVQKAYAPNNVAGAHQTTAYDNSTRGYLGPCPPPADAAHTYELALYALSVPTLPNGSMGTSKAQAKAAILANMLGVAKLNGTADR
jgi:Raf kinase inhibitor-like YbhB/YbcL family protein